MVRGRLAQRNGPSRDHSIFPLLVSIPVVVTVIAPIVVGIPIVPIVVMPVVWTNVETQAGAAIITTMVPIVIRRCHRRNERQSSNQTRTSDGQDSFAHNNLSFVPPTSYGANRSAQRMFRQLLICVGNKFVMEQKAPARSDGDEDE